MKRILYFVLPAVLVAMTVGCRDDKNDAPAMVSSLNAFPGHNRALVEFATPEGAVSGRVFYGAGKFKNFTIDQSAARQKILLSQLPEGEQVIRVVTYNSAGNNSDPKGVKVTVYGTSYSSNLKNRTLLTLKRVSASSIRIDFDENKREDELGVRVFFVNLSGSNDSVFIDRSLKSVTVKDINLTKPYYFCTVYKPAPTCIDEFVTSKIDAKEASMKIFTKDDWIIAGVSDELTGKEATKLFDNNVLTDWQSKPTAMPHWVAVDMQLEKIFSGFSVVQSQDPKELGFSKDFRFEVSNDNVNWETVKEGRLKAYSYKQTFHLDKPVTARYYKLTIRNAYNAGTTSAQLAEIDLFNDLKASGTNGTDMPTLKNARAPFKGDGSDLFPGAGAGRMQKITDWTHSSNVKISFDITESLFSPWCAAVWGVPAVNNGKMYQTLDLLPGLYLLKIDVGKVSSNNCAEMYGVVATGTTLPDYNVVTTATETLGQDKLSDHLGVTRTIPFTVKTPSKVTIGTVFNLRNMYPVDGTPWTYMTIRGFTLSPQ